jgi:voltage-gated potassium channel
MERSDHYVIIGATALADNTAKALTARGQRVTFIVEGPPAAQSDPALDVVNGDPSNLDTLRKAGAQRANALLALTGDDSQNAFVVLAMKELSETVKTVALVNSARNLASVRRVHPDVIIAPYVLGGELLAMALSGEHVDGDAVLNQLLYLRS